MPRFWRNNGLSMVLLALFVVTLAGQSVAGHRTTTRSSASHGQPTLRYTEYLASPSFLEATMENWESEFLQMAAFVVLTAVFFQRGSAESKDPDGGPEPADREPDPAREGAPGPVRRGGLALALYRHSLSLTFAALFVVTTALHAVGGAGEENAEAAGARQGGARQRARLPRHVALLVRVAPELAE
jgi:hypothetical protein